MDESGDEGQNSGGRHDVRSTVVRSIRMTLLIFGLLLAGVAFTAWLTDDADLPFDYEGFD